MALDSVGFVFRLLQQLLPIAYGLLQHKVHAIYHRWTYTALTSPKNIVVVGGSFAGIQAVKFLCDTLPSGWRVVLIEKNSHFNFLFNFPRFSVVPGHEHKAFIPYEEIMRDAPPGSFEHIQGCATKLGPDNVCMQSGESINFEYLVLATGSAQQLPAKAASTNRDDACSELRGIQSQINAAERIAIVGAGAVGVETATDIKSFYPSKNVTIFSSRDRLLPGFGLELHNCVSEAMDKMGIVIRYNQRVHIDPEQSSLRLSSGDIESFDLILACTGQKPNSGILRSLAPEAISEATQRVLVRPTLQLRLSEAGFCNNIFALGDVADTGAPKMARAGYFQAQIVAANVLSMIHGNPPSKTYEPRLMMEGCIKLTVGKGQSSIYIPDPHGRNRIFRTRNEGDDLDIAKGWGILGARFTEASLDT